MATKCISCGRERKGAQYCLECYTMPEARQELRRLIHQCSTQTLKARLEDHLDNGEPLSDAWRSMAEDELTQRGELRPVVVI